jgi:anthranilate phosphoribosyltransferase
MKKILNLLFEYKTLPRQEAKDLMLHIADGRFNDTEIASLITVYLMRSITIDELQGFRDALLEVAKPVHIMQGDLIDIVGTGGDGKNTFNISTLSSFVVAGAGQKIAKHGNYGASSVSGSSNVLEYLGYRFKGNSDELNADLERSNFCFMHAPLFHPALKVVGSVRKQMGVRTFFNLMGPLVNPAMPAYQLVGVSNLEIARLYNYLLQKGESSFSVIHSLDGYDEISLTGDTRVITNKGESVFSAEYLGKRTVMAADLYAGNSVEDAAKIFLQVLQGKGTWAQHAVVIANAAMGLFITGKYPDYETCYQLSVESLESGRAFECFTKLISQS